MSTTISPLNDELASVSPEHAATPQDPPRLGAMSQRRVLGLAVPIIGENLLQTMVGVVDTFLVAKLGQAAVAGVGASIEIVFFIISILSAVSIGATVLVSQAIGGGDSARANRLARQAISWGVLLAIPVSLIGFLAAGKIIAVFGTEPDVAAAGTTYLKITAATSIVLLLTFVCGAIFRGAGDSRTPLKASVLANLVNVVAAYGLIFGHFGLPEMGVAGSAWGTAIGRGVGAAVMLVLLLRGRLSVSVRGRAGWRPDLAIARQLMRLGVPAAIEQAIMSGGFMTMIVVVALLGTASLAAQQITFVAISVAFQPGFGFAIAATALVGQSIGARNLADARVAARYAAYWSMGWMAVGGVLFFVFARQVLSFFTSDAEVIELGIHAMRAFSIGLPFWGIWSVTGGVLRGSGDTRTPMIASTLIVWSSVGFAWVLVALLGQGLGWVWLTFFFTAPVGTLLNFWVMRRRLNSTTLFADQLAAPAAT